MTQIHFIHFRLVPFRFPVLFYTISAAACYRGPIPRCNLHLPLLRYTEVTVLELVRCFPFFVFLGETAGLPPSSAASAAAAGSPQPLFLGSTSDGLDLGLYAYGRERTQPQHAE
eukprot:COSAG05_NODE_1678_length_4291_cov_649.414122_6_plen_114_part_00